MRQDVRLFRSVTPVRPPPVAMLADWRARPSLPDHDGDVEEGEGDGGASPAASSTPTPEMSSTPRR